MGKRINRLAQPLGSLQPWRFLTSPWGILTVFAGLGLVGIFNHVMWRDEFNTWLIVRDSDSLGEMLGRVNYQGHTALWALCVAFLQVWSRSPLIMQLFHWAIAVLAMGLFWRFSPFSYRHKILFTFGYLPFYEYFIIARPYAFGVLFLFLFCAVFPVRQRTYLPAALCLAFMANSNAYALFISSALLITLALEFGLDSEQRSQYLRQASIYDLVLSLVIIAASYGFALYILIPPADSYNHGGLEAWRIALDGRRMLRAWGRVFAGYTFLVPNGKRWFDLILCGLVALVAVGIFLLKLIKKPLAVCFLLVAYGEILGFTYLRFMGLGPRHFGHFYLVLLAALWLGHHLPESQALVKRLPVSPTLLTIGQAWYRPLLTGILTIQFLGGFYGLPRDLWVPLSASREVADYIQTQGWQEEFIVASSDSKSASVAGYLDRQLYYPELRGMGSFTIYSEDRQRVTHAEILAQIETLMMKDPQLDSLLMLLNKPLEAASPALAIQPIEDFTRAWIKTERYYLYRVDRL